MNDSDLARLLQEEYDREIAISIEEDSTNTEKNNSNKQNGQWSSKSAEASAGSFMSDLSPVDPSLEFTDPNPDIRCLFLQFNAQFFWTTLSGIEVKWSPRMTLCAGLCVYEGWGGLCSVRLSLPLLKLRPRKDLVETLLHEMIHAYLFVTNNDRDHDGHGPNFLSHMHRINKATGANISVYHSFHDEVDLYKQHWWLCNGPCRKRPPYYGYVKRSMNRAPSHRDFWWDEHQATCGGEYAKVKEPEGYGQKKSGKSKPPVPSLDIRNFMGQGHVLGSTSITTKRPMSKAQGGERSNNPSHHKAVKDIRGDINSKDTTGAILKPFNNFTSVFPVLKSSTGSPAANASVISDTRKSSVTQPKHSESSFQAEKHKSGNKSNKNPQQNSSNITNKWKATPQVNNKKVVFPKNFVSVCESNDFYDFFVSEKREKKKYIMDDLDSNDDLWDECSESTTSISHSSSKDSISLNAISSSSCNQVDRPKKIMNDVSFKDRVVMKVISSSSDPVRQVGDDVCQNSSDMTQKQVKSGSWSAKSKTNVDQVTHDSDTKPSISSLNGMSSVGSGLSGEGYKLGNSERGSSLLAQIRKSWQDSNISAGSSNRGSSSDLSNNRHSKGAQMNKTASGLFGSGIKRKSEEAFGEQESSSCNSNSNLVIRNHITAGSSGLVAANRANHQQSNASDRLNADHTGQVSCPVCTLMVSGAEINAHLDFCLM